MNEYRDDQEKKKVLEVKTLSLKREIESTKHKMLKWSDHCGVEIIIIQGFETKFPYRLTENTCECVVISSSGQWRSRAWSHHKYKHELFFIISFFFYDNKSGAV